MRFEDFVPIKCRLPECPRMILPVEVTLNRLAAPRCVFNFIFLTFLFFDMISGSSKTFQFGAAADLTGAPFFGASRAIKMLASMRGPISTSA